MKTVAGPARRTPASALEAAVLPRIRSLLPSLSPSDARVARAILNDPSAAMAATADALARRAKTSSSTVVRCCQRMGFRGYRHLQLTLAGEVHSRPLHHGDIADDDRLGTVLSKVFAAAAHTVAEGVHTVDHDRFTKAVKLIAAAHQLLFVGVGTSAPLAQDAAYRFRTIGAHADAPADVHVQHVAARLLGRGDVCIAITHTGSTRETVMTLRAARDVGATTIAVTSFARSSISHFADIVLVSGGPEQSFRHEAMASRLAHLCLLDALYVAVAMRSQAAARRALNASADVIASHRSPRSARRTGARPEDRGAPKAGR